MQLREAAIAVRNFVVGGNLAAVPLWRNPRTALSYVSECMFLRGCLNGDRGLPQHNVWKALGRATAVNVTIDCNAAADWFGGNASFASDLVSLCMLCQILNPRVIFEIGTYHGSGTLHLASNSPEAKVFTLDLPAGGASTLHTTTVDLEHIREHRATRQMFFDDRPEETRITRLNGDSATFDFTPWRHRVDLFFIDGAHSYEYVRNDTMKAFDCCHPGSVIAWHDYGRFGVNGVSRWLDHLAAQGNEIHRVTGGSLAYMRVLNVENDRISGKPSMEMAL